MRVLRPSTRVYDIIVYISNKQDELTRSTRYSYLSIHGHDHFLSTFRQYGCSRYESPSRSTAEKEKREKRRGVMRGNQGAIRGNQEGKRLGIQKLLVTMPRALLFVFPTTCEQSRIDYPSPNPSRTPTEPQLDRQPNPSFCPIS